MQISEVVGVEDKIFLCDINQSDFYDLDTTKGHKALTVRPLPNFVSITYLMNQQPSDFHSCKGVEKKSSISKVSILKKLPDVLILQLDRMHGHKENGNLMLSIITTKLEIEETLKVQDTTYELKAIVSHFRSGPANNGHYKAYVQTAPHQWIEFDDHNCSEFVALPSPAQLNASVVFYQKSTVEPI